MAAVEVVSLCPFVAGAFVWEPTQEGAGQSSLTVMVKGTFALRPGELTIAEDQDPLSEERHLEDSALASLHWPGDYAPMKRKVDVTLVGYAYAPGGRPVDAVTARLSVGDLTKAVRVTGDRVWTNGAGGRLVPGPPAPFVRLPLRYERAALSADNPVGLDAGAAPVLAMPALPNLEPDAAPDGGTGMPSFGPISPQWRPRRRLLDESATFWAYGVARAPRPGAPPIGAAPPGFEFAYFNAAPADQQLALLRASAPLVLEHLDPDHARLETRLPAMRPQVFRLLPPQTTKVRVEEIILRCDTLWIDTERRVVVLTWRGVADAPGGAARIGTLIVDADPQGKKLRWDRVEKRYAEHRPPTLRLERGARPGAGDENEGAPSDEGAPDPLAVRYDGIRLQHPPTAPARGPAISDAGPDSIPDEPTRPLDPPRGLPYAATELAPRPSPATAPRIPAPSPPRVPSPVTRVPAPRPPAPPSQMRTPSGTLTPRKDLGVERYGAICAELAQKGKDRAAVLRAHLLTEPGWQLVEAHWKKAIARETEAGDRSLLLAFDEAYLGAQQRLGAPIGVREYARIQVGLERGEVGRVLAELDLSLTDLMRLQRVWTKRLADAPGLAAELGHAVEEVRAGPL